ncbi:hypothetical protein R3P38DRAFT_2775867 [Favolaschia claudopus]|uniref:Uncharacterized protein n=1 Tax=Favolaschia claudopus TaxID=2862362 RepID=A0AAW0BRM7_9AGAR
MRVWMRVWVGWIERELTGLVLRVDSDRDTWRSPVEPEQTRRVGHRHLGAHGRVEKTLLTQDCSACQAKIWLARHLPFEVKVNKQKPMLFVAQQFALSRTSKFRSFLDGSSPNPHRISSRSIFGMTQLDLNDRSLKFICVTSQNRPQNLVAINTSYFVAKIETDITGYSKVIITNKRFDFEPCMVVKPLLQWLLGGAVMVYDFTAHETIGSSNPAACSRLTLVHDSRGGLSVGMGRC